MRLKRLLPPFLLIIGFAVLFFVIKYRESLQDLSSFNLEKLKTYVDNFFYESSPELKRRRPFSLTQKETELKLYIGQPFKDFSYSDWREFWNLVYGSFPKEPPEKEGLPPRMRQLTQDEIAFELMSRYSQPFAYFGTNQWQSFFGILFKK